MLELLQDKIAAVRLQASHLAASITEHLMNNEEETEGALAESFVDNVSFAFFPKILNCLDDFFLTDDPLPNGPLCPWG